MTNEKTLLPVIALRGVTVLPGMIIHFDVNRKRSFRAIEAAMLDNQRVFLITQRDAAVENPGITDLYQIGTTAYIKQVVKLPQNVIRILVEGEKKAELLGFDSEQPYLSGRIAWIEQDSAESCAPAVAEAMLRTMKELFERYARESGKIGKELAMQILDTEDLAALMAGIEINLPLTYMNQQHILEAMSLEEEFEVLGSLLTSEIQVAAYSKELQKKVKERIDKNQREYVLREQLKVIREELGEDRTMDDADEYLSQLKNLDAPQEIKERIQKEISRFRTLGNNAAETNVSRGYIETLLSLPWNRKSHDSEDLKEAARILDEGHYGLVDVKERILEFLAVRSLTHKGKSPILCLAGPPGTGKTSIAKSLAEAMHKKYVRVCLGGVRDEAEIRGHRRTYVGAMAGRITAALQQAGVSNPLMLLDEIDKTSSDHKGDTSSALLEVLDPEQNSHFNDHYIDMPQDLSEVLFIATANDAGAIPRPLLDRMELIEISGYTENEKMHIARRHLIPKQMDINGIEKGRLVIQEAALRRIINHYTREAGVRNLERVIRRICRKTARMIMEENRKKVTVTQKNLSGFLGKERYNFLMANKKDEIGIARGLAWTQAGGDTLQIEVNVLAGKGDVILTGRLGDVMQESARTGMTYIRSIAYGYGVEPEFFKEHDIHVHIPEGAVPKDGPSAGITMATAILSAIIEKPVKADLAMTGEITLRGRVLAIGGLKEKLLAARYAGIHNVLVPEDNKADIAEMDQEILEGLNVTFVDSMKNVLASALVL